MAWYHRLLNMTRRDQVARDIEREMAFHLAERVDELMADGMNEAEAMRQARLRFGTLAIAYLPLSQLGEWTELQFQLRTSGEAWPLAPSVTTLIEDVHPMISFRFTTLSEQVAASLTRPRILAVLSGFFGAVAILLAMIGLYGTLSYRVTSRRAEIGVRLALGAARTRVLGMVLGEVGRLVIVGVALGAVVALASTRLLGTFLFGVTASDPVTLALSAVALAVVAMTAGALPAWRAARLDPMVTLREE